ncbi:ankyrin repeat domain-containing protein [Photobacterium profundum]|uniref:Uncharacterized protein n=1 Tax=Photobacterium profundum (strain SS9) TaxID=298386 RepID=Q6LPM3_PHOPR|nr:ankyrin repeat domain-containing protein [Photobacterium profundum]CAG20753.1 hypothetical protein PBPRA2368 [Photobacterium profundum SS9]
MAALEFGGNVIKRKFIMWGGLILSSLFVLFLALMTYSMSKMTTMDLVFCSSGEGGFYVNGRICELYMGEFRATDEDVEEVSYGGVDLILNMTNENKKYQIAEFFISKGLDVNGINKYQEDLGYDLAPLHVAVLFNDPRRVTFLLKHGANLKIRSKFYNDYTPLELAIQLQKEQQNLDMGSVINMLSSYK